jgi:hypothetical protein
MHYRMLIHCVCRYAGSLVGIGEGIVAVPLIRCRGMVGMEKVGHRQSFCELQIGRSKFQRAKTVEERFVSKLLQGGSEALYSIRGSFPVSLAMVELASCGCDGGRRFSSF